MYFIDVASLRNNLKRFRQHAQFSQQKLAGLAGISRQAYAAVEAGTATPSTEAALRLARALGTRVDGLFSLAEDSPPAVQAELVGAAESDESISQQAPARRARLVQVGHRLLARPLLGTVAVRHSLVEADGLILRGPVEGNLVEVQPFDAGEVRTPTIVMLGCDPAAALVESELGRHGIRLVWVEEGSYQALAGLARGEAHVAGCHLKDDASGLYNLSWVQRVIPFPCTLVTFADWQQGLIVAPGNPKDVHGVEDLAKREVRIVNRPSGSGSRSLLDRLLQQSSIPTTEVAGYEEEVGGHLAVASAVASGQVDAGVAVQSAASTMGLEFVPLEEERYDLVIPDHFLNQPEVQVLLDLLDRPSLQRRVEALGGYDVSPMGHSVSQS